MAAVDEKFQRIERRVQWSAHALRAAAMDLASLCAEGYIVDETTESVRAASDDAWALVPRVQANRQLAGQDRRVRNAL
jgi:hypothetical protein